VKLTETGLKRFREMAARHEQWMIELLGGLSRDEKDIMIRELGKLKAHVNTENGAPQGSHSRREIHG
jgi:DNA-binding MarR family transcriptional regulator